VGCERTWIKWHFSNGLLEWPWGSALLCSLRCLLRGILAGKILCHHGVIPGQLEGTRLGRVREVVLGRKVNGLLLHGGGIRLARGRGLALKVIRHRQRQGQWHVAIGEQVLVQAGYPMRHHFRLNHVDPLELLIFLLGRSCVAVSRHFWPSRKALEGHGRLPAILFLLQQLVGQRRLG